ncbi:MAG: tetratricopeptide repeat protein [Fibrobacteria bacterium]|nr:tetratricopeptide repeat protein [Fibrobacteria bacterium]
MIWSLRIPFLGTLVLLASCRQPDLARADRFLQLEDWPRAIALYDACVQEDPDLAVARLGLALSRAGLEREAETADLDSARRWQSLARDFLIVERLDSSQSTAPDRADALFHAALCWQRDGHLPQAVHAAEEAQATGAKHPPSAQFLARLARAGGDAPLAERWYNRALEADSSYLPAWAGLGELSLSEGDPEGALLYFEQALRRSPDHPWLSDMVRKVRDSLGLSTDSPDSKVSAR